MRVFEEKVIQCRDSRITPCSPNARNTILSMSISGILGWVIGFMLVVSIGSGALFHWELMPLLPLFNGLGWSLLGMIIGGSGLFDKQQLTLVPSIEPSASVRHEETLAHSA